MPNENQKIGINPEDTEHLRENLKKRVDAIQKNARDARDLFFTLTSALRQICDGRVEFDYTWRSAILAPQDDSDAVWVPEMLPAMPKDLNLADAMVVGAFRIKASKVENSQVAYGLIQTKLGDSKLYAVLSDKTAHTVDPDKFTKSVEAILESSMIIVLANKGDEQVAAAIAKAPARKP